MKEINFRFDLAWPLKDEIDDDGKDGDAEAVSGEGFIGFVIQGADDETEKRKERQKIEKPFLRGGHVLSTALN